MNIKAHVKNVVFQFLSLQVSFLASNNNNKKNHNAEHSVSHLQFQHGRLRKEYYEFTASLGFIEILSQKSK
jgi:hypothetical protein